MPETYDEEAVQQILRLAMIKQGQDGPLLRSQLLEIAEELGISESSLAAAEEEWQVQTEEQQAREEFAVYRHQQLRQGIVRYIIINSFLVMLNVISTHRIDWVVYPVLIWGAAIALQAWQVMQGEGESYDRAFRRWRLRQQIGQSFKAISERFKLSWTQVKGGDTGWAQNPSATAKSSDSAGEQSLSEQSSPSSSAPMNSNRANSSNTESKSRLQNRMGDRLSPQNRIGNSTNGVSKDRDHGSADHLTG